MLNNEQYAIISEHEGRQRRAQFDAMKKEMLGNDFPHGFSQHVQVEETVHRITCTLNQLQKDVDRLSFMIEKLYELRYHKAPPRHVIT